MMKETKEKSSIINSLIKKFLIVTKIFLENKHAGVQVEKCRLSIIFKENFCIFDIALQKTRVQNLQQQKQSKTSNVKCNIEEEIT